MKLARIVNLVALGLLLLLLIRAVLAAIPSTALAARGGGGAVGMVVAMFLLAMPVAWCAKAFDEGRLRRLMGLGVALGAIAGLAWMALTMVLADRRDVSLYSITVILGAWTTAGAAAIGFMGLMIRQRQDLLIGRIVRLVAIALVALALGQGALAATAMELDWPAWDGPPPNEPDAAVPIKVAIASGVLAGGAVIASLVLAALSHGTGPAPARPRFEFGIRCPRCGRAQRLRSGGDACAACGLRITVEAA